MAHFVSVPPDQNYAVPQVKELPMYDKNGTGAIAVWGLPPGGVIWAFSQYSNDYSYRFVAARYNPPNHHEPDLAYFYLRGLVEGDKIAVGYVKPGETATTLATDWLPITHAVGDHFSKKRAAGMLPRSPYKFNFLLDPAGSEQRFPHVPEAKWTKAVNDVLLKIHSNPIGLAVMGGIIREITIVPWVANDLNANSAVTYTPEMWHGSQPGALPDEILFHELVHVLEDNYGSYKDDPDDSLVFDGSDFMSVTISNVYASCNGRPLRKDHQGFTPLPEKYAKSPTLYRKVYKDNFADFARRLPAYAKAFSNASAPNWNPFAVML